MPGNCSMRSAIEVWGTNQDWATTITRGSSTRRDLRDLTQVSDLAASVRLMRIAASRTGGLLDPADLARDAALQALPRQRDHLAAELLGPLGPADHDPPVRSLGMGDEEGLHVPSIGRPRIRRPFDLNRHVLVRSLEDPILCQNSREVSTPLISAWQWGRA
jgi:hypothetical protein